MKMLFASQYELITKHQKSAPVDVLGIARDLGINVYKDNLSDGISGVLRKDAHLGGPSGYVCLVKDSHPETRQRFTIAHEIAHFLLHREDVGEGVEEDEFYRALSNPLERQANDFAADILMPWHLIDALTADGVSDLNSLAPALGVSRQALAIRLGLPYDQHWD